MIQVPVSIHSDSPALIPSALMNPNQTPLQLRRATYIHVSDLTNAYNMDHARLEEELARVKADEEQKNASPETSLSSSQSILQAGVPTELDTSHPQRRLQPPRTGYNLCVLVGQVKIVVDKSRVDGSRVRLAEVEVGDETGAVSLRARDDQIDLLNELSQMHGTVVLRNCTMELYQGKHIRLAVTKWGKMSSYPDQIASTPPPPSKINRDRKFSHIDLTIVASELVGEPYLRSQHQSSPDTDSMTPTVSRAMQQYGNSPHIRHNKGGRRPPAYSRAGAPVPGLVGHPGHVQHANHPMAGLHGYTEVSPFAHFGRPENVVTSQHQLMYQRQQYQMQQQHAQLQHMYQSPGEQQRQRMLDSPMMNQGIGLSTSFESFGGSPGESDAYLPTMNAFTMSPTSRLFVGPTPPSPGMNPRAATYDPDQK